MPPVSEPLYSALMQRYAKPKGTKLDYEFRSNDYQTVITQADPGGWDEKVGEIPGKVTERWHSLLKYDMKNAYADNNPLTLQEAFTIAQTRMQEAFPDMELQLMDVALHDRLRSKQTGKYLREKAAIICIVRKNSMVFPSLRQWRLVL